MPLDLRDIPDCIDCGTCCFSTTPDYLTVSGFDFDRLGDDAERLTHFIGNRAYMKLAEGHCAALVLDVAKGQFLCSVYARRPDVCRWLEQGSSYCIAERHEKTERPLVALRLARGKA